jgi:AmmeMemoRadiSam system protein A
MPFLSEDSPSIEERKAMLELARRSVTSAVQLHELPSDIPAHGIFSERRALFVTLRVKGKLHGCIGVVDVQEPLGEGIVRCAAGSALQDPRFPRLRSDELRDLEIEISLLSPLFPTSPDQIEIGKHGLLITRGSRRGLLLPQVAVEHGLDWERFVQETCRKAGIDRNSWRDQETKVFAFTCEVFSDQSLSNSGDLSSGQSPSWL